MTNVEVPTQDPWPGKNARKSPAVFFFLSTHSSVVALLYIKSRAFNFSSLNDVISTNEIARFKDKGSREYKRRYTLDFQLKVSLYHMFLVKMNP